MTTIDDHIQPHKQAMNQLLKELREHNERSGKSLAEFQARKSARDRAKEATND
jgi:hypothetical protein